MLSPVNYDIHFNFTYGKKIQQFTVYSMFP